MVVLVTGVSGIGISKSIQKFIKNHKDFFTVHRERKPFYIKLDDKIKEVFYSYNQNLIPSDADWLLSILTQPYPILEKYWHEAIDKVIQEIQTRQSNNSKELIIINITACYYHPFSREYISLINIDKLRQINPEMIITFIDDIYDIQHRLKSLHTGLDHHHQFKESDVILKLLNYLDWRSNEIMMSRLLANHLDSCEKNFVFSIKHSFRTLSNLVFEEKAKIYLSHPITESRRIQVEKDQTNLLPGERELNENYIQELENISNLLTDSFTTFLPTTIDEYRIKNNKKKFSPTLWPRWDKQIYEDPKERLYVNSGFNDKNELWKEEGMDTEAIPELQNPLEVLHNVISHHVTTRDCALVEQSNHLVIFRPFFNGKLSTGVETELKYFKAIKPLRESKSFCFTYCPKVDFDLFIIRQFENMVESELKEGGKLIPPNGIKFVGIEKAEKKKLLDIINKDQEVLFHDFFTRLLDKYHIEIGVKLDYKPLGEDEVYKFILGFWKKFLLSLESINIYKETSDLFITDNIGSNELISQIIKHIEGYQNG